VFSAIRARGSIKMRRPRVLRGERLNDLIVARLVLPAGLLASALLRAPKPEDVEGPKKLSSMPVAQLKVLG